jgi:heme-degrading monooxygenase HmoA
VIITSPSDKYCIIDTFKDFFASIKERATGLKGYAIMHNDVPIESTAESVIVVLTFWNSRDDMDDYYKPENKHLSQLVASVKPFLKQMPERTSYIVSEFVI